MAFGRLRWFGFALCFCAWPAVAFELELPRNARQTAARDSALDQVEIPVAPFAANTLETRQIEGVVTRRAYKITSAGLTPLQILAPLRKQVEDAGYELVLDCNQITCGGYDFRFAIEVLPAPNMYVNIRAFHYLAAFDKTQNSVITLLASSANEAGYLQVIQATQVNSHSDARPAQASDSASTDNSTLDTELPLAERLIGRGFIVLRDIKFEVGKTALDDYPSAELDQLASLLSERPSLRIAVVGHTDTVGGLDTNIAVSRARAQSVRLRLIQVYGVEPSRIEAEGMGYLAPRNSNLTAEGQQANRRVEVIVISDSE